MLLFIVVTSSHANDWILLEMVRGKRILLRRTLLLFTFKHERVIDKVLIFNLHRF